MSCPVTLSIPTPHRLHTLSLIKHMECNPRGQAPLVVAPAAVNAVLKRRHSNLSCNPSPPSSHLKMKRNPLTETTTAIFCGDAKLWDVTKFPSPN